MREEIIAANLYTGPMFVKYNAVLRGLRSDSTYLKNSMIRICCPNAVANEYMPNVPDDQLFLKAEGTISLADALRSLNRYPTTLAGINSSIIKLGK